MVDVAIKKWFEKNSPWCPLFGTIPFRFLRTDKPENFCDPIELRCLKIIRGGRSAWGVGDHLGIGPDSWPKPEKLYWYPQGELLTARGIFWHVLDIFGASGIHNPGMDPDQIKHSEILWHARDYGRTFEGAKEVEDYKMLAVFSIYLAWNCLKGILTEDEYSSEREILKNLLLAEGFLKEAENIQKLKLKGHFKKAGAKGGKMRSKIPIVYEAIEEAEREARQKTEIGMWRYLKNRYSGGKRFITENADLFFDDETENLLTIRTFNRVGKTKKVQTMKDQRITFSTFKTYVKPYRKNKTV